MKIKEYLIQMSCTKEMSCLQTGTTVDLTMISVLTLSDLNSLANLVLTIDL